MHQTEIPGWAWLVLGLIVVVLLAVDLWSYHGERRQGKALHRKNLYWTIAWICVGLGFGGFVWVVGDGQMAQQYYAAYAMEKGLSLDNLFLFYVIFKGLKVAEKYQHRVLFWGILGAVVFRGIFIFLGVEAIERWNWVSYLFAAILLYGAWRSARKDPGEEEGSRTVDWLSDHLPVTKKIEDDSFLADKDGKRMASPLLLALLAIELTDVMFAVDSVPAALSVTHNRFLVYSSNIFAILGLRALYLYLQTSFDKFRYLHYGLA
ncbi:MAG: TerC/Alx family metal homeostasis membrane protein, partial [Candidatus Eremiobacteraeota bacterium]|nr:TerC/Alx family metal homeostasis membrane protein [Candidatus Eremiobacteraeota bacterium]